jgi:hypothetical protein
MITIFEGPRNSGKTYLSSKFSEIRNLPVFKFDFVGWFNKLNLRNDAKETHLFATGKELMLLQLNRDSHLYDFILDRGFATVLTWGILAERITEEEATNQLKMMHESGLLQNLKIVYVVGNNPIGMERQKDNWDYMNGDNTENEIMSRIMDTIKKEYGVDVILIENDFTSSSIEKMEKI